MNLKVKYGLYSHFGFFLKDQVLGRPGVKSIIEPA